MQHAVQAERYRRCYRRVRGFTIVELLIVIIVVAILATLVVVAYNGVQERARAAALADGLKQIDKAFHLYAAEQGRTSWWLDNDLNGSSNPKIRSLLSTTGLGAYLHHEPTVPGMTLTWIYDNDGDTYNGCTFASTGVNVNIFPDVPSSVATSVDRMIDDGNPSCGKLRFSTGTNDGELRYIISAGQSSE